MHHVSGWWRLCIPIKPSCCTRKLVMWERLVFISPGDNFNDCFHGERVGLAEWHIYQTSNSMVKTVKYMCRVILCLFDFTENVFLSETHFMQDQEGRVHSEIICTELSFPECQLPNKPKASNNRTNTETKAERE